MARLDVVLDVETIGPPWTDLDESTREYLAVRAYRDDWRRLDADQRDAIIRDGDERVDRTALELGLCEVIAVGLWLVKEDRGYALVRAPHDYGATGGALAELSDGMEYATVAHACELGPYDVTSERGVLMETWRKLAQCSTRHPLRVIGFNSRAFDLPVLAIRSAQLGIRPSINPLPYRYNVGDHCDLADVLAFQGATRSMYSLDWWCRRFGVPSPKAEMDGAKVGELWREGRLEDVATYVIGDVRAEARLFRRLAPIIRLLEGGADVEVDAPVPTGA